MSRIEQTLQQLQAQPLPVAVLSVGTFGKRDALSLIHTAKGRTRPSRAISAQALVSAEK